MILTHFLAKNHSKLPIEDKSLIQYDFTLNLCFLSHLIAQWKSYNTFWSFFLTHSTCLSNFSKKLITQQFQDHLSCRLYKYWQLLICILVDLEWVYQWTISKWSDKQWLRFHSVFKPKWLDHWRVNLYDWGGKILNC